MKALIIVSSVSASGKTTLVEQAIKKFDLYRLKTCTTRPVREEETGDEYHFIPKGIFNLMIHENQLIEYAEVYGEYYGLPRTEVDKNADKNCIVIMDVQGAKSLKKLFPHALMVFIMPPKVEEIIKRLAKRDTTKEDIKNRHLQSAIEIGEMNSFDEWIKCGSLGQMKEDFNKIVEKSLK